jgi:hypothetical protein
MYKPPLRDRCNTDTRIVLQLLSSPLDPIIAVSSALYRIDEATFKAHLPMKCYGNVVLNVIRQKQKRFYNPEHITETE